MGNRGSDSKRRALKKKLEAVEDTCWLCGYALRPDAEPMTDYATEVDEEIPASLGGDVYGVRTPCHLVHRCCNNEKSGRILPQFALSEWFEENHMTRESYQAKELPSFWVV